MSVRPIVPIVGLTGLVAGIVGFGDSSSKQLLTETPSFSRKLKSIDSVEVSYSCTRELPTGGAQDGVFTVKENELKGKEGDLLAGKSVNAKIEYDFKAGNDFEIFKGLADKKNAHMTVSSYYYGGLKIVLRESNVNYRSSSDVTLLCRIDTQKGNSELRIRSNSDKVFSDSITLDNSSKTVSLNNWNGSVWVSLLDCPSAVKDEGVNTCGLKVTDLSGWRWGVKVNANAQFEFSPWKAQ